MNSFDTYLQKELDSIKLKKRLRVLKIPSGIDFSSNDYLGLSKNDKIKDSLINGINIYGAGSGASRLIRGHRDVFERIESEFANWVGSEDSLFLSNGFAANSGLIDAISDSRTIIFTDRLNHASILDGIRISGAIKKYYNHCDMNHLRDLLKKADPDARKIIVSETLFSMDGDIAPIQTLISLKKEFDTCLILDEAHALGIFGIEGNGLALAKDIESDNIPDIDFRIYTGGKSLGLEGAFIACKSLAKNFLINKMRTFIFSTAPLPSIAYALSHSINIVKGMGIFRKSILDNSSFLRNELQKLGFVTLNSVSQIIPVILYEEEKALFAANFLQEKGFDIRAIRPPTVKESRLRISINANIKKEEIKQLINGFEELKSKF